VPFGSYVTGLGSADADLDLCIIDAERPNGKKVVFCCRMTRHLIFFIGTDHRDKLPPTYDTQWMRKRLTRYVSVQRCFTIPKAVVPIVKFSAKGVQCDLNFNEQLVCLFAFSLSFTLSSDLIEINRVFVIRISFRLTARFCRIFERFAFSSNTGQNNVDLSTRQAIMDLSRYPHTPSSSWLSNTTKSPAFCPTSNRHNL
jgi:hypothetical protein